MNFLKTHSHSYSILVGKGNYYIVKNVETHIAVLRKGEREYELQITQENLLSYARNNSFIYHTVLPIRPAVRMLDLTTQKLQGCKNLF